MTNQLIHGGTCSPALTCIKISNAGEDEMIDFVIKCPVINCPSYQVSVGKSGSMVRLQRGKVAV